MAVVFPRNGRCNFFYAVIAPQTVTVAESAYTALGTDSGPCQYNYLFHPKKLIILHKT